MKRSTFGFGLAIAAFFPAGAMAQSVDQSAPGRMMQMTGSNPAYGLPDAGKELLGFYSSTNGITGEGSVAVSTSIYLPKGEAPEGGWPILAYAHGTVGVGDSCAPSRNPWSPRDVVYLNNWLLEGYAIVASDYQGLGTDGPHPYLDVRTQSYSILDSVRAAQNADLSLSNRVLMVGHSQGAGAAFAASAEAPYYAPEIDIVGTIANGIPYFGKELPVPADGPTFQRALGYMFYITSAANAVFPQIEPGEIFTEEAMKIYADVEDLCTNQIMERVSNANLDSGTALRDGYNERLAPYIERIAYDRYKVDAPVLVVSGTEDIDTPPEMQRQIAVSACEIGTPVLLDVYEGFDHSDIVNGSFKASAIFARNLMDGLPVETTCARSN